MRAALAQSGLDHGPISVYEKMRSLGMEPVPSTASLARIFRDQGVARVEPRKKPRASYRRFVYPAPNACWPLDATEYVLTGGRKCVIFQLIDHRSRLAVASHVTWGETSDGAIAVVSKGIQAHGVPQRLLSDNGAALNPFRRGVLNNVVSNVNQTINRNANGSYVTISGTASSGKSVIQAAGLEPAYRSLRNSVDLAEGHPATASSTYSAGFAPNFAADGNGATGWSASASDTNAWWQVDLGSSTSVAQVQVVARQDLDQAQTRTGFQVGLSNDPTFATFTTAARQTASIPDAGSASFNVFRNGGKPLGIRSSSTGHGAVVEQETATAGSNQLWYFLTAPNGSFSIANFNSGQVLEIGGNSTAPGAGGDQWIPLNQTNQNWTLTPVN